MQYIVSYTITDAPVKHIQFHERCLTIFDPSNLNNNIKTYVEIYLLYVCQLFLLH